MQDKIEMEDFKLKQYFPLKLFDILEEKIASKELSLLSILSQTKYFKKLLEQANSIKREQNMKPSENNITLPSLSMIDSKMHEVGVFLEKQA